ncbi:hypothetical protein ACWIGI_09850 [Nocardia sp. NPDC055321]
MRSSRGRGTSARAGLARVLAVLAALIGLALLQSSPCLDQAGTAAAHALAHGTADPGSGPGAAPAPSGADLFEAAVGALDIESPAPDFDVPVELAAWCVAVLIAALALLARRTGHTWALSAPVRAGPDIRAVHHPRRAYSLAMLCVLRT